jgi:hypothetical protein
MEPPAKGMKVSQRRILKTFRDYTDGYHLHVAAPETSGEGGLVGRRDHDIVSVAPIVRRAVLLIRELLLIKFTVVRLLHRCRSLEWGGGEGRRE